MKKIVLLGDSIRMIGYGKPVAARLAEEYEVWQPAENCRYAQHTLRGLWDWKADLEGADIIHWNNGLWDLCCLYGDGNFTPIDSYVQQMVRLGKLLKERAQTVIFATTTPVRRDNLHSNNEIIAEYNATVVPKLREIGIVINDLYTPLVADVDKYISDDKIHLSAEGAALATDIVEDVIRREAGKLEGARNASENAKIGDDGAPV
jgi:hypothetical protein